MFGSTTTSRTFFVKHFGVGFVGLGLVLGSGLVAPVAAAASDPHDLPQFERIIGGTSVASDAYPFMVSLQNDGRHFCGGTLVTPYVVMTAAHCVTSDDPETGLPSVDVDGDFSVVVGRTVLSDKSQGFTRGLYAKPDLGESEAGDSETEKKPDFTEAVGVHPRYLKGDFSYDVAFLELDEAVEGIVPVRLPTVGTDALIRPGQKATVLGWGNTDTDIHNTPDRLRKVDVPMPSSEECMISYEAFSAPGLHFNPDVSLCAGVKGKGSCHGDSGGPLFRQLPGRENAYQTGIVSYGDGCGSQGAPGVYVSLSSMHLWETMAESEEGQRMKARLGR